MLCGIATKLVASIICVIVVVAITFLKILLLKVKIRINRRNRHRTSGILEIIVVVQINTRLV